ncbi:MAG: zinc-ribbon domain-containing protein [Burkholderiales bacterium]
MGIFERLLGGGHHGQGGHGGHGGGHGRRDWPDQNYGNPPPSSGVACPSCRAANSPSARFCQQCGASMVSPTCQQCGAGLQAGSKFCSQCGKAA